MSNAKFFALTSGDVPVVAYLCLECGNIQLLGDVSKAKKLMKR